MLICSIISSRCPLGSCCSSANLEEQEEQLLLSQGAAAPQPTWRSCFWRRFHLVLLLQR